ncbi:hypothetical protein C0J52_19681 [Blattella germanica]|nr:hypothetical protein C0J52_19681 [Blattella germanica]
MLCKINKIKFNNQINSKQRQLLTKPTTSNAKSEFNINMCRALFSADIPLYKLKNEIFREYLQEYTQHTFPDEKTYALTIYHETVQKIRDEIKDGPIWVSIDETTDKVDSLAM